MSSFFWGYMVSQVYGGSLADHLGGDMVLVLAGVIWSTITLFTPLVVYLFDGYVGAMYLFIFARASQGVVQGMKCFVFF